MCGFWGAFWKKWHKSITSNEFISTTNNKTLIMQVCKTLYAVCSMHFIPFICIFPKKNSQTFQAYLSIAQTAMFSFFYGWHTETILEYYSIIFFFQVFNFFFKIFKKNHVVFGVHMTWFCGTLKCSAKYKLAVIDRKSVV